MRWLITLAVLAAGLWAAPPEPAKAGLDAQTLARIPARMKAFVDDGAVAGVVTLVQRRGVLAALDAAGMQELEARKPMRTDSIFQIMSMTKPITGVAVMQLADEGRLRLNDPVERWLPEFRGQLVIESRTDTTRVLRKPARLITVRDLMSHTSGLPSSAPGITEIMVRMDRPLGEAVAIFGQQPLEFEPGSRWAYSNAGIATLGRIVEVVSGLSFERYLDERIFAPLGMRDSHIVLPEAKRARLAMLYQLGRDGKLERAPATVLGGDPAAFRKGAVYSGPDFALYSTAEDLARFYQMMLDKGSFGGKRLLSPAAVETMTALATGDLPAGHNPGHGFGLTWEVVKAAPGTATYQSTGTFGHGGAFGTYGWIDPRKELVGVFLIQHSGSRTELRDAFVAIAGAAVIQ
jgi:CubicO group peptidase (beta-lactamase class C family)